MPTESNSESTSPIQLSNSISNSSSNSNSNNSLNGATERKNSLDNSGGGKLATMSHDPTPYIQRARVTRPAPPKPSCNPMQFVQIKPCSLYQTAQEQLKKAEEVKKVKEIKKEEPEDWQCNLDNWKSSRRKRVEHIIDRVVEVKKLELEEHDRTRRKSKTFSEMLEERSSRRTKLASLAVYTEDESNDLSDLGIGTSSTSGKSSLSEDYDNHSVMSDNVDTEKSTSDLMANDHHHLNHDENGLLLSNRDYISSPGYETSSSTAPTSSPDPCEYTYEGAIQDYKTRISRAQSNGFNRSSVSSPYSKDSTPERNTIDTNSTSRRTTSGTKIENRLMNFEVKSSLSLIPSNDQINELNVPKKDLPKVDILKRRELFEKENNKLQTTTDTNLNLNNSQKRLSGDFTSTKSIRERLSSLEKKPSIEDIKKTNRLSGDIASLKDRLQNLERQTSVTEKLQKIDVPVVPLKDRLSSLQNAATKEEVKKPVLLVDEHQLEIMKKEDLEKSHTLKREMIDDDNFSSSQEILNLQDESNVDTDREDSGIHTTDVSCSVSQTDEQPDLVNEESHHHINVEDGLCQNIDRQSKNTEINEKFAEPSSSFTSDVVKNSSPKQLLPKQEELQSKPYELQQPQPQQQQQPQQLIEDNSTAQSPEPTVDQETSVEEALDMAFRAIDEEELEKNINNQSSLLINEDNHENCKNSQNLNVENSKENSSLNNTTNNLSSSSLSVEPIYENIDEINKSNQEISSNENPIKSNKTSPIQSRSESPVKQIIRTDIESSTINSLQNSPVKEKSHYQVPQSSESLYETPKHHQKPIPVYENIEILYPGVNENDDETFALNNTSILEPPKEKPPPPPIDENDEDEDEVDGKKNATMSPIKQQINNNEELSSSTTTSPHKGSNVKRMNSTKRIKKELRNKRSSFLGIEGNDDDIFLELTVAPPPDMAQLLQEERRLEKQLYMKAGLYESSDAGDSRDSGVSENHSRQSSEPFTNSSEEHDDLLIKKEKEIIEVLEKEEIKQRTSENWSQKNNNNHEENDAKIQCIEDQIREQEEVLRVERELLQLEQEELKRQRENLILRENLARRELAHGAKMLMSANHRSLQDINNASTNHYANIPNQIYQVEADYRKSMSDLADFNGQKRIPPTPPAKPLRSHLSVQDTRVNNINNNNNNYGGGLIKIAGQPIVSPTLSSTTTIPTRVQHSQSTDEFVPLRNYQPTSAVHHGNMTRHTLHALSAAPKPKYTDGWVQSSKTNSKSLDKHTDSWLSYQQKRKSIPEGFNYNKHWLIQEAEQRRIDQQRGLRNGNVNSWNNTNGISAIQRNGSSDNKPLPDAVIQTLTQRVQNKGLGERKRMDQPPPPPPIVPSNDSLLTTVTTPPVSVVSPLNALPDGQQDKILSVSGKKKCSHCGDELGRGAAMIIESLRLFYHIQCFKCCVCHVQLGDGLNGTDVRVRNHKLHCHNCYSSDDGIKFSCV